MNLAAQNTDLVAKAAALMESAHAKDSNWPLTGLAERRMADRQGGFGEPSVPGPQRSGAAATPKGR